MENGWFHSGDLVRRDGARVSRHIEIVDALPRNAAGKVLKFKLRE